MEKQGHRNKTLDLDKLKTKRFIVDRMCEAKNKEGLIERLCGKGK